MTRTVNGTFVNICAYFTVIVYVSVTDEAFTICTANCIDTFVAKVTRFGSFLTFINIVAVKTVSTVATVASTIVTTFSIGTCTAVNAAIMSVV